MATATFEHTPHARAPHTRAELAAALESMETAPPLEFRKLAAPAELAELRAVELDRPDLQMRARLVRGEVLLRQGDIGAAGRIGHEALAWATENHDAYVLARGHCLLSQFFRHVGDAATGLAHAVQGIGGAEDLLPPRVHVRHLLALALALDANGSPDEAVRRFEEALDLCAGLDDVGQALVALNNMAYIAYEQDDEPTARELVSRMRGLEERRGVPLDGLCLDTIARVEMMRGRYAEAETILEPVLDGSAESLLTAGDALAGLLLTVAEAQRLQGATDRAQTTLDRARRICGERGLVAMGVEVRREQSRLYAATDRYREAYEEHQIFYAESHALQSAQRESRARTLQAVFEAEEARRESVRLRELAYRDPLTDLYNRRFIDEQLPVLLGRAAERGTPLAAALIDLDHFKRVNDTLSHETGDTVLKQVAALIAAAASGAAIAARLGGEEFLLLLPDTGTPQAVSHCDRLRLAIRSHPWRAVTGDLPVTASIGVATVLDGRIAPSALLARADRNLYAAKREGRDRVVGEPESVVSRR